jgi:hypothetical protein
MLNRETGSNWHQTTVAKVESGRRSATVDEAVDLAFVLCVPLSTLVDERGQ